MAKIQTMIRLDPETRVAAEKVADSQNRSLSNLIETVMRQWLVDNGHLHDTEAKESRD